MAAAEARAIWQRAANRCFVQEDAKRAPKLACCQSSSSTNRPVDAEPTSEAEKPDHPVTGFMPFNRTPSHSNLPADTRWWLQLQPSYGYQKGLTYEELSALEAEVEILKAGITNPSSNFSDGEQQNKDDTNVDSYTNSEFSAEFDRRTSNVCIRKDYEIKKQGVKAVYTEEHESMDLGESYEKLDIDSFGCSVSKKASELCFDPVSPWTGSEKTDPWWRVTDKGDLASFVAQKSLDHIENCDLPPPQKMHVRRHPYASLGCFDRNEVLASSSDWKVQTGDVSNQTANEQGYHDSGRAHDRQWTKAQEELAQYDHDKSFRTFNVRNSYSTRHKDGAEIQLSESDPSKAQLLEALRHSQTRAREAEKAAQQAYDEKEHIIKLFFRQASQLFAYKQWFQLLQLENLYFQIKNNNQPISSFFPVGLPWMPSRGRKMRKSLQKAAKGKRGKRSRPRHDIGKYAVAFALGLGLVGAGLLLGWTVGWMLPPF